LIFEQVTQEDTVLRFRLESFAFITLHMDIHSTAKNMEMLYRGFPMQEGFEQDLILQSRGRQNIQDVQKAA